MKKVLYIGNNLSEKTNYNSTMSTLSRLLINEGFEVTLSSSKTNIFFRLLDMCIAIIKHRKNVDYIFIDTFSTLNFYYALITSQLSRLLKIEYIPILHGGNLPLRIDKSSYFSNLIFNNSFFNISPSNYLLQEFSKRNFKTVYIPNLILIKDYEFRLRKKIEPKLLWVRAFEKTYNPLLAIKVLVLLKESFKNVQLCMVGPDKDGSLAEIKLYAKKNKVQNNVTFTGVLPKEKWHKLSKDFDVFINTTNVDNMPVSIIEAMALGFPIVSTNVGGLPYLINNGVDGVLVPKENEIEMTKAIINLINRPDISSLLSDNARKKAELFDVNVIKKQWLEILS